VHKVQHKPRKKSVRGHNFIGAKRIECAEKRRTGLSGVPPDSVWCTRPYNSKPATLGNSRARSAIIHRTVRYATGLSSEPAEQRLPARQRSIDRMNSAAECSAEVRRAPDCPVQLEDKSFNCRPTPNPNGWLTWRRTGRRTVPVRWRPDCPARPSPASLADDYNVVGGYKYPPTTTSFGIQVFQRSHSIQELVHSL
jgi:hypothetical protein